jgi:hypothetical protein
VNGQHYIDVIEAERRQMREEEAAKKEAVRTASAQRSAAGRGVF